MKHLFFITFICLVLSGCGFDPSMELDKKVNCLDPSSPCFPKDISYPSLLGSFPEDKSTVAVMNEVEVTFSELVKNADLSGSYSLSGTGANLEGSDPLRIESASFLSGYTYLISFAGQSASGEIILSFPGVTDMNGNAVAATLTFYTDTTPPVLQSVSPDSGASEKLGVSGEIRLVFDEAINITTVSVSITPSNETSVGLAATNKSNDTVVISPPTGGWNHSFYAVTLDSIAAKDLAGNSYSDSTARNFTLNRPPSVSQISGGSYIPGNNSSATITATVSDPDSDPVTCSWEDTNSTGAALTPSGTDNCQLTVSYDFSSETDDTAAIMPGIRCTVTDSAGDTGTLTSNFYVYRNNYVYVKSGASGDGSSPANAYGTIQDAMTNVTAPNYVVVSEGSYNAENTNSTQIELKENVVLAGGYDSTTWLRHIKNNLTIIYFTSGTPASPWPDDANYPVECNGVDDTAIIEGFHIESNSPAHSTAVMILGGSTCTIQNNILNGGPLYSTASTDGSKSSGVLVCNGSPRIINNILTNRTNTITIDSGETQRISWGIGILLATMSPCTGGSPVVINNIIDAKYLNCASCGGKFARGTHAYSSSGPKASTFYGNIVITTAGQVCNGNSTITTTEMKNNVFYNCSDAATLAGQGSGNLNVDPGLSGDYLSTSSPCSVTQGGLDLSGGISSPVNVPGFSIDRELNSRSDPWSMGAHEYDGSCTQ